MTPDHANDPRSRECGSCIFADGNYTVCYERGGDLGPFERFVEIVFIDGKVHGRGCDEKGIYVVAGFYSQRNHRIALSKVHHLAGLQHGQMQQMRLEWRASTQRFEGKWYNSTESGKLYVFR